MTQAWNRRNSDALKMAAFCVVAVIIMIQPYSLLGLFMHSLLMEWITPTWTGMGTGVVAFTVGLLLIYTIIVLEDEKRKIPGLIRILGIFLVGIPGMGLFLLGLLGMAVAYGYLMWESIPW